MNSIPSSLIIRRYVDGDADELLKLFKEAVAAINIRHYSPEQVAVWTTVNKDEWRQSLKGHETFVAEIDGVIVGFADLRHDGYLDRLYINKDYQGRFIYLRLLRHIEHAARDLGLNKVFTHCSITAKIPAERAGYKVIKEQTVSRDGVDFINYVMEKEIS